MLATILNKLPQWLEWRDPLAPADVILVLDGGDIRYRFDAGGSCFARATHRDC